MKKKILLILEVLFAGIFIFSAYKIIMIYNESSKSAAFYDQIRKIEEREINRGEESKVQVNPYAEQIKELKQMNSDVLGWIKIDDTEVDYPLAEGVDNAYYLSHLIDKTYNEYGAIFMDMRNHPDFSDRHTIIYGHNALNGTMFGSLKQYTDEAYYQEHSQITIYQEDQVLIYEVFGFGKVNVTSEIYRFEFSDDHDYLHFITNLCSELASEAILSSEDKILTLSTCTDYNDSERFIVCARLAEIKQS